MDFNTLLGTSFACDCGKQHTVPTENFIYDDHAYASIADIARNITRGQRYLLIADQRTFEAAGKRVKELLQQQGIQPETYIIADRSGKSPAADDNARDEILAAAPDADLYLAVGSGVVNDLVKWVSFLKKKPYITVPTAASMNGYASANVAASIGGLKVLFHAEACKAAFVEPEVLYQAPDELTTSGLGDVLAKSVSSADWKLNQFLFGDYYCQFAVDLLKDLEPVYLDNPEGIRNKEQGAFKALFEALFYSSIAMTITGTSAPASGGEHLISHTLDMTAARDGVTHDYHGRQVGVASILMAALYGEIMTIEVPQFVDIPQTVNTGFWGELSAIVAGEYEKKLPKIAEAKDFLSRHDNWQALCKTIKPMLADPARLKNCLEKSGGIHTLPGIRRGGGALDFQFFFDTVVNANQMRSRFTILDLAVMTGVIPNRIDALIKKWVS
ncbi:MAG: hypothetical protein CSB24_01095 [Deltaproteobacteria bacterium]|nr:MAG: hypothetical protein CSB24_01095 [Deltaproteobacteria bacterium]